MLRAVNHRRWLVTPVENPPLDSFVISLPFGWEAIELEPDEVLDRLRERLPPPDDSDSEMDRRRMLLVIRRMVEHARQAGIVLGAVGADTIDAEDEPPLELVNLLYLATVPAAAVGADVVRFEQVKEVAEREPEPPIRRLRPPTVERLQAGDALRDIRLRTYSEVEPELTVLEVRYHLLIGAGEGMAVLGFLTPNVELADELLDLFHAVADTLEFVAA
jgi:hypothetical protein